MAGVSYTPPSGGSSVDRFSDVYRVASPATSSSNQMRDDTAAFRNVIAAGRTVQARGGSTYLINGRLVLPSGLRLFGSYTKLKVPDQLVYTTTAPVTVTNGAANATFNVSSATSMFEGMCVCVEDGSVTNVRTFASTEAFIPNGGISGTSITISFSGGFQAKSYNTSTNAETVVVSSYTFPTGTKIATISQILTAYGNTSDILLTDIEIIGNRQNQQYGTRWELSAGVSLFTDELKVDHLQIDDAMSDACIVSGDRNNLHGIYINRPNGNGFHLSDGGPNSSRRNYISGLFIDSVGMLDSGFSGHWGQNSNNPAYGGIICSSNEYDHHIEGFHITNSANSKMCSGITHINGASNKALRFNMGKIRDQSHGAFEIHNNTGTGQDPYEIHLSQVDVYDCGPQRAIALGISGTFGSPTVYQNNSLIGYPSGPTPLTHRCILSDCTFENSPLVVQGGRSIEIRDTSFCCNDATKSASLIILASGSYRSQVELYNVRHESPLGNLSTSRSGWFDEYRCNVYINNSDVSGNGLVSIGGNEGVRTRGGAVFTVSNTEVRNNYDYGLIQRDSTSVSKLSGLKVIADNSYTHSTSYMGVNGNPSGNDGLIRLVAPEVDVYAQSTTEIGINLSASTVSTSGVKVIGGFVSCTGSAVGKAFNGGGASTVNEFINVAYDGALFNTAAGDKGVPHRVGAPSAPSATAGTAAGTAPTIAVSAGVDGAFTVTLTAGTSPTTGTLFTINLANNYGKAPVPVVTAGNANAAGLLAGISATATTSSCVVSAANAPTAASQYILHFHLKDISQDTR